MPGLNNPGMFAKPDIYKLKSMLDRLELGNKERQERMKMLMYLHKHHYPNMGLEEIIRESSKYMYDKEMSDMLFNQHCSINQHNIRQRRGLGIPEESDKDYVYEIDSKQPGYLEKLWNPKPETWM